MFTILVNAYACSPNMGSEPGMGWNWCVNLAKYCELHIITEGEFRDKIEEALPLLPQGERMHFYYNPVSDEIRRMCWNQGDWRFYKYYRQWQRDAYKIALEIIESHPVDIVHQLNMVGFREPGFLWKIRYVPFVWGPIGGLKQFPVNYLSGAGPKMRIFNRLKNIINILQIKYDRRVHSALQSASCLISSIPDSYHAIKKHKGLESVIIPETGCYLTNELSVNRFSSPALKVMWVGKFDFRKQLPLALKAIAKSGNKKIELAVYGTGSEKQTREAQKLAGDLGVTAQVIWHGNQPNSAVLAAMQNSHLFFFTSVSEDTSTVVLEAISNRLPVLCFDACGFGAVIDNSVGIKIKLSKPDQSVSEFAEKLNFLESNRELLKQLSQNCAKRQYELSWEVKAKQMAEVYKNVTERLKTDKRQSKTLSF